MRKKRMIAVLAALTLAVPYLRGEADYSNVTLERFPDADVVVVDSFDDIVYNPDGTYVRSNIQTLKILTEKGRRDETEITMSYSARYGKAAITSVTVTSPDGTKREVDVASVTKETTDNSSASENIYDPMHRKLVCVVPGVKVGDLLTYSTRSEVFASRIKDQWAEIEVMEWGCPMLNVVCRVKSPPERPLKAVALRHPLGNVTYSEETLEDGSIVRIWTAKDSPQMFPEPDMPPQYTQVQNLRVSTAADWREISRWYWDIALPHLEKANENITNKVAEIARSIGEGEEEPRAALLKSIYKWVAQEIRYMGLTMEDASPGYSPHDVDITFENRYGVCRDKAALLVAMLRIAGFEAYPVLIHAGAKMDPDVPMPYFNHAIAAVAVTPEIAALAEQGIRADKKYILMDPTDESSRDLLPAYLSDRSYLVATPEGEALLTSPIPQAESNAVRIKTDGVLGEDGAMLLESRMTMSGINDNTYRQALLRRKKEARRKLFERLLTNLSSGAELIDLEITPENLQDTTKPIEIRLTARLPETLIKGETRTEFATPLLSRLIGTANWILEGKTSLDSRKYPLVLDSTAMVEEELTVDLGGAVGKALKLPRDVDIQGPYSWTRSTTVENGKMTMKRRVAVNAVEFSPTAYLEMRERLKEVEAAERERPVFEKNRFAGANAHIHLEREDVWVASPSDWVVTNTVLQRVLTYDGKKKLSELKFDFNPTWKEVEIVSAVVSNKDGKVSVISPHEMNTFDCAWAASAPRYPASKSLIVNLPGVEVGSVISCVTATKIFNAPAEFYGAWDFEAIEPTDQIVVNINGDEKTVLLPKVVSAEPMTADGDLWRNRMVVSSNDFAVAARRLRPAVDVGKYKWRGEGEAPWGDSLLSIRDWMAKNIRVAGPSLYEVPLAAQMTDVATVLDERYGSRLDYIRTMCALMKGAGFDADIVFAANDAGEAAELRERDKHEKPNVRAFAYPLCRVTVREGGFLWWGGTTTTYFFGAENEYSPLGTTAFDGASFFDPVEEEFGVVKTASPELASRSIVRYDIYVRENGSADVDYAAISYGAGVAAFRKKYSEMLPEERDRHYQELLGAISQGATATKELTTDVTAYPATLKFSAFVPNFAVISGDMISISVPEFYEQLFPIVGGKRQNPIGLDAVNQDVTIVNVVFPEGYTALEHLPEGFSFADPVTGDEWYSHSAAPSKTDDGRLAVSIVRVQAKRPYAFLPANYSELLRDWSRIGAARSGRTISATK